MVLIENDVVNCYDRIHIKMAALVMTRMGMAKQGAIFMLNLLEKLAHHIILDGTTTGGFVKTKHGSYLDCTGKGTGWSSIIWLCLFDFVLTATAGNQPGIYLKTPNV